MNIKAALSALVACCLIAGSMSAQSTRPRPRLRAKSAMWAALHLTESQTTQVKTIHRKYGPAMKVARKQPGDSSARVYDREMTEVRALLTFSQQQTFDSYMSGEERTKHGSVTKVLPVKIAVPR